MGCELEYQNRTNDIELIKLEPTEVTEDWPYPGYPLYLPYFPLELEKIIDCSFNTFCELSTQKIEAPAPGEVIIFVPASPVLGMSMWGPMGDQEGVQIVFRYDLENHIAQAHNQCG